MMVISKVISFLLLTGWLNNCACFQATSPLPPLSLAVSFRVLEPLKDEVVSNF